MTDFVRLYGSTETRGGTRAVLKQLTKRPNFDILRSGMKLHQMEVASFAADSLRQIWMAAQVANLKGLSTLLERAYIEACTKAQPKAQPDQNQLPA